MGTQIWPPGAFTGAPLGRLAGEDDVIYEEDPTSISTTGGFTWNSDGSFSFTTNAGGVAFTDQNDALSFVIPAKDLLTGEHITGALADANGGQGWLSLTIDHLTDIPTNIRIQAIHAAHTGTPTTMNDFNTLGNFWGGGYSRSLRTVILSSGTGGGAGSGSVYTNPDQSLIGQATLATAAGGEAYNLNFEVGMSDAGEIQSARSSAAAGAKLPSSTDELFVVLSVLRDGALTGGQTYTGKLRVLDFITKRGDNS